MRHRKRRRSCDEIRALCPFIFVHFNSDLSETSPSKHKDSLCTQFNSFNSVVKKLCVILKRDYIHLIHQARLINRS